MSGGGNDVIAGGGTPIHILMFPWLALGHISPFAHLARKIVAINQGRLRVTFLTAAGNIPRVKDMLASAAGAVAVLRLQLPHVPGLPAEAASTADLSAEGAELLKDAVDGTRPQVAELLAELRPDAVVFDFATPWICAVSKPLGIRTFLFRVFSAISDAFLIVPARRRRVSARDLMSAPAGFPSDSAVASVPAYQAADCTYVFRSFGDGKPSAFDRVVVGIEACDGIIVKSCMEMEGPYIDYLSSQLGKPMLLTGPVMPEPPQGELEEKLATWLSSFSDNSVVFASFGSETFLTVAAATELLLGLQATNRPFLAVLNFPRCVDAEAELKVCLPPGFEERVRGTGLVHTGWVQQQLILEHRSVGCYLNHAGFSSVVEGLIAGCRLVLLPMKVDQYLNAVLFARDLLVGVEVARRSEDGWFGRDDVRKAVDAAMADGGDGSGTKWKEFLMDHAVQTRYGEKLLRDLKELLNAST